MADRWSEDALEGLRERPADPDVEERALLKEAKTRADECLSARDAWFRQRDSDREFMEDQFTDSQRDYRRRTKRPTIEIHLLHTRIEQVLHDWRTASVGFRVGSAVGMGGADAARMFNGLAQRDMRDGGFDLAMQKVVEDSITLGEGWGKVVVAAGDGLDVAGEPLWDGTDWSLHAALGVMDRRLRFEHCEPESIWPDPHAVREDRSDLDWLIETRWMTREQRDARWPDARALPPSSFETPSRTDRIWFSGSSAGPARDRLCRIALYWRRLREQMDYVWLPDWETAVRADRVTADQKAQMAAAPLAVVVEKQEATVVELAVMDGETVLEGPVRMPMTRIPYFRAVGKEVRYSTGEMVPRGLVALLRGPSKWMTVSASDVAWKQSTVGLNFMTITREALEGNETDWEDVANPSLIRVVNEYEQLPPAGQDRKPLRPPQWMNAEAGLSDDMQVVSMVRDLASMVGGAADAGQAVGAEATRSGVALDRMERMAAVNRSEWIYGAEKNTMRACGEIWLDLARNVYSRQGRRLMVASETPGDPDEGILVGVPFFRDADSGEPVMVPVPLQPHVTRLPLMVKGPAGEYSPAAGGNTMPVHRFLPRSDRVMVTTFSSGLSRLGADAKAEYIGQLLAQPAAQPVAGALLKSAVRAVADVLPMDDVIRALDAALPTPSPEDETDVSTLAGRLAAASQENEQLRQQLEQASAAANQTEAAKEIERMRSTMSAQSATTVAEIRAAAMTAVADLRSATAKEIAKMQVEQKREEVIIENAERGQEAEDENVKDATIAGMNAAVRGAQDGGRTEQPGG